MRLLWLSGYVLSSQPVVVDPSPMLTAEPVHSPQLTNAAVLQQQQQRFANANEMAMLQQQQQQRSLPSNMMPIQTFQPQQQQVSSATDPRLPLPLEQQRRMHEQMVMAKMGKQQQVNMKAFLVPAPFVYRYPLHGLHGRVDSVCGFHPTGPGSIPSQGTCMATEPDACEICV